ncbi:hypothetical protein BGZ49_007356 [Haplosporangium sp. Z 27]|nr:hypothetical protein BGZ49_007356 [Haplosporangium sp. Z 27]
MSKVKNFQVILRGQQHLLHQVHTANATTTSTRTVTAGSLRLLNSHLNANAGPDFCSCSIHTQTHSQQLQPIQQQQRKQYLTRQQQQQQQQQQQCFNYSSCQRHHPRARQRDSAARLLHTSASNRSPSPSSTTASAAAASSSPSSPTSDSNANDSSELKHSAVSASSVSSNQQDAHVFTEQISPAKWVSELPWIDPNTLASYEPGHGPARNDGGGNGNTGKTTGTGSMAFFDKPFQNTRHNYVFAHGASGFAKHPGKAPTLTPEEDRAYCSVQVGEDSYFRRHDALGVADGVGGWSNTTGANPALYSRKLMHYAFLELEKYDNIEEDAFYDYFNVDPVQILAKSYEQSAIDAKKEGLIGSSTACIAILRDDELRIANLGDCGVSVIRRNEFIFRTEEQQHSFNYPYQLGTGSTDTPQDALVFTVKVESGDIVVMGSDGIFDNLFDEDILEEVVRCVNNVNKTPNTSPFGTGKPAASSSTATATSTLKSVGGLWSGITSGAAKLASSSSSTIAAIAGKSTTSASSSTESEVKKTGDQTQLHKSLEESSQELSPIAAVAIAAAESTAASLSDSLYTTNSQSSSSPSSSSSSSSPSLHRRQKAPEPSIISDALAKRAKNVGEDTRHHGSPFQSRAMQEGLYYQGGKRDDMSVLVAIIKVAEDSPDRR